MGGCLGGFDGVGRRGLGWWGGLDGGCGECGGKEKNIRVITAVRAVCAKGDFKDFDWL
jgi:hypothetical protein